MLATFATITHHGIANGLPIVFNVFEAAIMYYLSKGYTERQTAVCLCTSYGNLHHTIYTVYEKAHLLRNTHAALVSWAQEEGFIAEVYAQIKHGRFHDYKMCDENAERPRVVIFVSFTA